MVWISKKEVKKDPRRLSKKKNIKYGEDYIYNIIKLASASCLILDIIIIIFLFFLLLCFLLLLLDSRLIFFIIIIFFCSSYTLMLLFVVPKLN